MNGQNNNHRSFFIACQKYVPAMWQHMEGFANQLLKRGHDVHFLISQDFFWMNSFQKVTYTFALNSSKIMNFISLFWFPRTLYRNLFSKYTPSALLLVSWHPTNFLLARLVKSLRYNIPVIVWLHEPYKENKRIYGLKSIIIFLVEIFQTASLNYADVVILHSSRAVRLFNYRYPWFKGLVKMIPLPFPDDGMDTVTPRRYISFLGRANRAKGIDIFFTAVSELADENEGVEFQIVTSTNISSSLNKLSTVARQNLKVVYKPQLSDKELRAGAASSFAVMVPYRETTQSGVIPTVLMKGTPIIGTNIDGITEWIKDKETGVLVPVEPSLKEIKEAINYVREHFDEMTTKCRETYLVHFGDDRWDQDYGWLSSNLCH